ncbi:hypothetical protein [Paenarthrobacter nitroguajacolicus]
MGTETFYLFPATIAATAIAAVTFVLLGAMQPGLAHDRRTFGDKSYASIEGMFFIWGVIAVMIGVFSRFGVLVLDISAGIENTQMLTVEVFNGVMIAGMLTATAAALIQWARLRAANRKVQRVIA